MFQKILVPIDGSETAALGLAEATRLAVLACAQVRLVYVLDRLVFSTGFEPGATYMRDVLPRLLRDGERILAQGRERVAASGVPVDTRLVETFAMRASDVICNEAASWGADLIVLGTHGRRGLSRAMLGSDAELVARTASMPVLVVPASATATFTSAASSHARDAAIAA